MDVRWDQLIHLFFFLHFLSSSNPKCDYHPVKGI